MMYIDAKRQQRSKLDKGFMLCYAFMEDKAVPVIVEKIWTKLYVGSIKSQTKVKTLPLFDRMSNMAPFLSSQCFLPEVSEYRLGLSDTTPAGNFRYLTTSRMLITRGERQQMNQNLTAFCFSSAIMVAELEDFLLKILSLRGPGPLQTFLTFWKLLRLRRFYF
ncbi:uncharacterized protein LOC129364001 isoform X4 [Poeciliopsis prolifica]|uniref:uncharacterized protein LOC129364001 isoform X4 n=1 Tax=Poeciliopsis prolifica TaxID=188132 RepID=UPI002413B078|nr:uncharacterized protein LOC129364001 isoform X4 [Poeciliopsis prolifica]